MHEETYPAFFTPRDKEPSLSSSEEKSLEFDWLRNKKNEITKIYMKNRASALYFTYFQNCTKDASLRTSSREISFVKKITTIYKRLFTPLFLLKD